MTFAWLLIDVLLLGPFGGLAYNSLALHIPTLAPAIPGTVVPFVATGAFGIGWLATVWLIPTEILPDDCPNAGQTADANHVQQPRILDFPHLRRHERHRWDLDVRVPARERRAELRGKPRVL